MNNRLNQLLEYNTSGIGCWLTLILVAIALTGLGLGWVINGFLIVLALVFIAPVFAFLGLQFWLKRKLIQAECPVCSYEFTGFKSTEFRCPSCGETLQVESDGFGRQTPPGTIDVDAIEVSVKQIEGE